MHKGTRNGLWFLAGILALAVFVSSLDYIGAQTQPCVTVVEVGTGPWVEPGYQALDSYDGDLTDQVAIGGDMVDTSQVGTYTVTYDVADSSGNAAETMRREVRVLDRQGPVITLFGCTVP